MPESFLSQLHASFGLPRDAVIGLVQRIMGGRVAEIRRVVNGYDNEVHLVALEDGTTVYARIRPPGQDGFDGELWAMERAREAGVPVPEIHAMETIASADGDRHAMVLESAPGQPLDEALPRLSTAQRRGAMVEVGRTLATLHSVRTPGLWRPDDDGSWPDPADLRRGFIADRAAERPHLEAAGLTVDEIEQTLGFLGASPDTPVQDNPVLCHGDASTEHIFVDADLRVCALIDWGMWHGGSAIGELAYVSMSHDPADLPDIYRGHGVADPADPSFRRAISLSVVNQVIGHIAHHVSIGDEHGTRDNVAELRRALGQLGDVGTTR